MKYANLGRTGLKVSRICLGCMTFGETKWRDWVIEEDESRAIIKHALEQGINFLDTANMYSLGVSEEIVGRAVKDFAKRDEVVLATKVYFQMGDKPNTGGLSKKHILAEVENSLRRLGTDYIDLYQIHRLDFETPMEETLETLDSLVKSGKVRYLGASSMFAWQFAKMLYLSKQNGWSRFVSMQNHYNLIYREEEREMMPLCIEEGVGVIPWSPLARGFLAGNRGRDKSGETVRAKTDDYARQMYYTEEDFRIVEQVKEIAEQKGVKPIQIALAWILHKGGVVSPIVGVRNSNQIDELIGSVDVELSEEDMNKLEEPYRPRGVLGHQ